MIPRESVPPLSDASLAGRRAFLAEWGDRLWAFWNEQLSVLIAGRGIDPALALGHPWSKHEATASGEIADRMIESLGKRPALVRPPTWDEVERWYAWLVGGKAARAGGARTVPLDKGRRSRSAAAVSAASDPVAESDADAGSDPDADRRHDILVLVEEWVEILTRVVSGTGIVAIEWDWLWATCIARRPLARYLRSARIGGADHLAEDRAKALKPRTSAPGDEGPRRTARTRAGAAACFRFNLESWALDPALAAAHEVFLGPATPPPPYRPARPADAAAVAGFRHVLSRTAALAKKSVGATGVEKLRSDVAACALVKAVTRLLPRPAQEDIDDDWQRIVAAAEGT